MRTRAGHAGGAGRPTINNLANAYYSRIRGDRAENLEQAITYYEQSLQVRTRAAMPVDVGADYQ